MDCGLGVGWPLSPYATALAAGAVFAFCIAFWKHRASGARKESDWDPSGRFFGGDLDPKKERDGKRNKPGKEKNENEAESISRNFPVIALGDVRRAFSYEHLCLSGQFGAIPRTLQRNQTLENPNLYSAFRWRNVKKEKKSWHDFNLTSLSFSSIYQQSSSRVSELPRQNDRFLLNISPFLQPYLRQFRDLQFPEISRTSEFDRFDVSINPDILKNKPITRSAVCLALERQLHRILDEPFRERIFNERAIQTADITEDDDDDQGASGIGAAANERNLEADCDTSAKSEASSDTECNKKSSYDSSLWDSGYGEKAFDERCSTPKEHIKENENILIEEYDDAFTTNPNGENNLSISSYCEIDDNLDNEEVSHEKTYDDRFSCPKDKKNDENNILESEHEAESRTEVQNLSDSLTVTYSSEVSLNPNDNPLSEPSNILGTENRGSIPDFSAEHASELNFPTSDIDTSDSTIDTIDTSEKIKNLTFEDNVNVSQASKCSDKELGIYREKVQMSSSDENILMHDADNESDSDIETLTCTSADRFIDFEIRKSVESGGSCLESVQSAIAPEAGHESSRDENLSEAPEKKVSGSKYDENVLRGEFGGAFTVELNDESDNDLSISKYSDLLKKTDDNLVNEESNRETMRNDHCWEEGDVLEIEQEVSINEDPVSSEGLRFSELSEISIQRSERKKIESSSEDSGSLERYESVIKCSAIDNLENSEFLEGIQRELESARDDDEQQNQPVSAEKRNHSSRVRETLEAARGDVTPGGSSRDSRVFDERGTRGAPRQMDRETGERSVAVESTVTTETTLGGQNAARLSTAVVSRLTLEDWSEDSVSVKTTVSEEVYRPTYEEFVPLKRSSSIDRAVKEDSFEAVPFESRNGSDKKEENDDLPKSPRVDRLKGLLSRDQERRSRTKFHHLPTAADGHVGGAAMEGEWDRLLRDVLASVSELERWERRRQHCGDVTGDAEDAEHQQQHHFPSPQSDSSLTMEEEGTATTLNSSSSTKSATAETPTKVKSLRFKLDPDVFDVPSDDSFYDDDDYNDSRRCWKQQQQSSKYRAFSSLELNDNEPVRLVSVHASVVPACQKMVARPVGIDLRVRLTEERQSKRAHVSTSPSQAKRRSPVSDRGIGWCQELSPVTENVDWRETFTPVTPPECKGVPNGILKTPSPKTEPAAPTESPNPFKLENGVTTNGVSGSSSPVSETKRVAVEKPKYNGWKPTVERKPFLIIRKKFEPDPEAIERITGYKSALSKPPLPPPLPHKPASLMSKINRAELARKQYLDSKAALAAANKVDGTKKFQQFLSQAQNDRAKIVTSVPDLAAIERAVNEQWTKERASVSPRESPGREDSVKTENMTISRGSTPDDQWASYVQSCRQHLGRRSQSMTYLETDIDIIPVLDEDDKCQSTSCLDEPDEALPDPDDSDLDRSHEDLDDSGRAKSEHELRIERSLRSLPLPEWYRRSDKTKTGFLLGSSNKEKRGWAAAKSLASSTSSLASCGLRRPVRSLRSSRENIPWSRATASPDGPTLSLALAKAFREPYLGWRARTPTSSGVSSSPRASPPSWGATTTDDEANGVSFDGEDAFGRTTSSEGDDRRDEPLSLDDTGADAVTVSMDTNDPAKLPGGEDTCDDINNMSMDTCELFDAASVVVPVDEDPSPQADTGDDIDNLSTDTTTTEGRKLDPKLKRYSYSQSIYHSEWDEDEESRGDRKVKVVEEDRDHSPSSSSDKVVWIESSFVGSRTTTSIVVLPDKKTPGSTQERPASR